MRSHERTIMTIIVAITYHLSVVAAKSLTELASTFDIDFLSPYNTGTDDEPLDPTITMVYDSTDWACASELYALHTSYQRPFGFFQLLLEAEMFVDSTLVAMADPLDNKPWHFHYNCKVCLTPRQISGDINCKVWRTVRYMRCGAMEQAKLVPSDTLEGDTKGICQPYVSGSSDDELTTGLSDGQLDRKKISDIFLKQEQDDQPKVNSYQAMQDMSDPWQLLHENMDSEPMGSGIKIQDFTSFSPYSGIVGFIALWFTSPGEISPPIE